jgi:DNA-binding NtrC family response regulator
VANSRSKILVVDDDPQLSEAICTFLKTRRYEVVTGATCTDAERLWSEAQPDLAILDYSLPDGNASELLPRLKASDPRVPIIILTGHGSIDLAVETIKLGAEQFLTKPADLSALLVLIERCLENESNRQKQLAEASSRLSRGGLDPFLGTSLVIRNLAELANRVAATDSPVLIQGETGTGKGVLARWLHDNGRRRGEAFVDLNCGGLSRDLVESELFGHEKGAFTGAVQSKNGLLEVAHKGTVFLDEIGDVDLTVQPKLLKVLEEKTFRRLGDVRDKKVDIRLIAATHQNLSRLVGEKSFRDDLYFRINTITLATPALRDRVEDIPSLARHILDRLALDLGTGPIESTSGSIRCLQAYRWPGNIRELRNVLERAILVSSNNHVLSEKDLHFDVVETQSEQLGESEGVLTLEQMERRYIEQVLFSVGGKINVAAKKLNVPRSSLYQKIRQYGIKNVKVWSH